MAHIKERYGCHTLKYTEKSDSETEVEVTAEFCYSKAAECLTGIRTESAQVTYISQGIEYLRGPDAAREWRLLGDAIASLYSVLK